MRAPPSSEAIIVGGGLIGLCCAAALARDGASVILLEEPRPGGASIAAAGMLAPSIDRGRGPAADFALAARDAYPAYLAWLEDATGLHVPLNRRGILQVALTDAGIRGLRRAMQRDADPSAEWLDARTLRELEPALSHALGGVMHPDDGAVDNVAMLAALSVYCGTAASVRRVEAPAARIVPASETVEVHTRDGTVHRARKVVLAGGAWVPAIEGLPRALPVTPLRGQMLAFAAAPLRHVVFGPRGYLVPRAGEAGSPIGAGTLVGATSERTGFDPAITESAARSLHAAGAEILPPLAEATPVRQWAGLRPMTPDLLPIIGHDREQPSVLYACGHSRNGVLMAPLTGDCISAIVRGHSTSHDLEPFSIDRFALA